MSRLVVVSNRIADPRKPAAGGLAVAVRESLQQTGGLWFGW
ncbi:trehalose 6-phosphate synthase, partial [Paraburkholderia hospita]